MIPLTAVIINGYAADIWKEHDMAAEDTQLMLKLMKISIEQGLLPAGWRSWRTTVYRHDHILYSSSYSGLQALIIGLLSSRH